jgi:hypothetical protein
MRMRFNLRDLLWLTAVVALAISLWMEHQQRRHAELIYGVQKGRMDAVRSVMLRNPKATAALFHCGCGSSYDEEDEAFDAAMSAMNKAGESRFPTADEFRAAATAQE